MHIVVDYTRYTVGKDSGTNSKKQQPILMTKKKLMTDDYNDDDAMEHSYPTKKRTFVVSSDDLGETIERHDTKKLKVESDDESIVEKKTLTEKKTSSFTDKKAESTTVEKKGSFNDNESKSNTTTTAVTTDSKLKAGSFVNPFLFYEESDKEDSEGEESDEERDSLRSEILEMFAVSQHLTEKLSIENDGEDNPIEDADGDKTVSMDDEEIDAIKATKSAISLVAPPIVKLEKPFNNLRVVISGFSPGLEADLQQKVKELGGSYLFYSLVLSSFFDNEESGA